MKASFILKIRRGHEFKGSHGVALVAFLNLFFCLLIDWLVAGGILYIDMPSDRRAGLVAGLVVQCNE